MAKGAEETQGNANGNQQTNGLQPESLAWANRGVRTGSDFANIMSVLMSDLISGRITPQVGNAVCNAGGKLLKIVEMQYKHGSKSPQETRPDLKLAGE